MTGRVETVKVLLAKGADVNVSTYGGSPLQEAARVGNTEIVDLLIAAGADVDDGSMLSTPLLKAIEKGNFNIALKLIAAGANPSKTTKFGSIPPIAMAAAQGSAAVIRALIAAGADVNILTSGITINHATIQRQAGFALKTAFNTLETLGKAFEKLDAVETGDAPLPELGETIESIDIAANRAKLATSNIAEPQIAVDTFPVILAARCGHGEALAVLLASKMTGTLFFRKSLTPSNHNNGKQTRLSANRLKSLLLKSFSLMAPQWSKKYYLSYLSALLLLTFKLEGLELDIPANSS